MFKNLSGIAIPNSTFWINMCKLINLYLCAAKQTVQGTWNSIPATEMREKYDSTFANPKSIHIFSSAIQASGPDPLSCQAITQSQAQVN